MHKSLKEWAAWLNAEPTFPQGYEHVRLTLGEAMRLAADLEAAQAEHERLQAEVECDDPCICCPKCSRNHHRTCPKIAEAKYEQAKQHLDALREEHERELADLRERCAVVIDDYGRRCDDTSEIAEEVRAVPLRRPAREGE